MLGFIVGVVLVVYLGIAYLQRDDAGKWAWNPVNWKFNSLVD